MNVIDRISDLSTLWKQVSVVSPFFDQNPMDWDQTYREFLPRVMAAEDEREFHLLLAEFMNRIGDGHTEYCFTKNLIEENGFLPFSLRYIDGRYYIREIEKSGENHLFAEVLKVNGVPFKDMLAEAFRYIYHVGDYAYSSKLQMILPFFLKKTGNELVTSEGSYRFDLADKKPDLVQGNALNGSMAYEDKTVGKLCVRLYDKDILYVRMDNCLYSRAAQEIEDIYRQLSETGIKGVILDLRENIGGMTMFGAKVAELFISGQFSGCQKRTRENMGIDIAVASQFALMSGDETADWDPEEAEKMRRVIRNCQYKEYQDSFGGPDHERLISEPCVILTARNTISAAEDLTAMFKSSHRAVIIGTPTYGSTGTPMLLNLSCGGRARVCSVGYRLFDGTEFIGRGIEPDIFAENQAEDYRQGTDCVLDRALEFIRAH